MKYNLIQCKKKIKVIKQRGLKKYSIKLNIYVLCHVIRVSLLPLFLSFFSCSFCDVSENQSAVYGQFVFHCTDRSTHFTWINTQAFPYSLPLIHHCTHVYSLTFHPPTSPLNNPSYIYFPPWKKYFFFFFF